MNKDNGFTDKIVCAKCRASNKYVDFFIYSKNNYYCLSCYKRLFKNGVEGSINRNEMNLDELLGKDLDTENDVDKNEVTESEDVDDVQQGVLNTLSPKEIYEFLGTYVIGQKRAKQQLASAVYLHISKTLRTENSNDYYPRICGIVHGPTGCGKTELFRALSVLVADYDIPLVICDATTLTPAGYRGADVESILTQLYIAADNDIEKTQNGIIFIDEFDKIASNYSQYMKRLQANLLKLIEGKVADVPENMSSNARTVQIDTSNIMIFCGGSFSNEFKEEATKNDEDEEWPFIEIKFDNNRLLTFSDFREKHKSESIIKYGFIPELIGRLPAIIELEELTKEEIKEILLSAKNSELQKYINYFCIFGIELDFDDSAIDEIIERAIRFNTGARALKSVIYDMMVNLIYELDFSTPCTIIVDRKMIQRLFR